jgi:cob(I)alamin adenosyltransferase
MRGGYYSEVRTGYIHDEGLGLIHACYGHGVGKTTRSIGLAIRAAGAGLKVTYVQFMKSGTSSEIKIFHDIPNIKFRCPGKHPFILSRGPQPVHYEHAESALWYAKEAVKKGQNLIICDEILTTLIFDVLSEEHILDLIRRCRRKVELVLTGVDVPPGIMEAVDYATEFLQVKHPYYRGHIARRGIEY